MRLINTTGIILKKQNCGEFDQFVIFFSPLLGKTEAIAKGSRKITSPLTGHLEILNICSLQLYKSSRNYIITDCKANSTQKNLRSSLNNTWLAILLTEIFQKTTQSHENDNIFYHLFEKTLSDLNENKSGVLQIENFKIKLLQILGILPNLSHCSSCEKKWNNEKTLSINREGQVVCGLCRNDNRSWQEIPFNIIKLVNFLSKNDLPENFNLNLNPKEKQYLKRVSDLFLNQYLNNELKTEKFIAGLS